MNRALLSSQHMDWATPPEVFDPLDVEFRFGLDVCATIANCKVVPFFDRDQNGLLQSWSGYGAVWCNPPYGRAIGAWIKKAWDESQRGVVVVMLIPARTDTAWWHDYVKRGEIRFIRGRIRFEGAKHPAPFPSAVVIFRADADRREGR